MWLASRSASVIVSADSRQVYRGFDIGTAKPTPDERAAVVHRGIDVIDPTERYSAAAWATAADRWIDEAHASDMTPLVVGGTGLYLRASFTGLFAEPALDSARRATIAAALAELSVGELRRWVAVLDPDRASLGRTQLLRSIEIALLTGRRLTDMHRELARVPRWRPRYLLVDPGPVLADRIAARVDDMLDHGWPEEVQRLMQRIPATAPAWKATGYDVVRRLVAGDISRREAREIIVIETRQYAKRQRTWFRHQLPADRVTSIDPRSADWESAVARWSDAADTHASRLA